MDRWLELELQIEALRLATLKVSLWHALADDRWSAYETDPLMQAEHNEGVVELWPRRGRMLVTAMTMLLWR